MKRGTLILLLLFFCVGLTGRLVFVDLENMSADVKMDAWAYHEIAVNLLEGRGYREGTPPDLRPAIKRASPLMPAYLAGIYALVGRGAWYAILVQCVLSAGLVFPLYGVVRYLSDSRFLALTAAAVGAFYPDFYYHSGLLLPEMISEWLLIVMVFLAVVYESSRRSGRLMLAACAAGLLTLARPQFLPVALLYGGYLGYRSLTEGGDRALPVRHLLAAGLVFVLLLAPFTLRNWVKYGQPIYGSTTLACNVLIGNQLGGWGGGIPTDVTKNVIDRHRDDPLRQQKDCREALGSLVRNHPGHVSKLMVAKFLGSLSVTRTAAEYWFVQGPAEEMVVQFTHPFLQLVLFTLSLSYLLRRVPDFTELGSAERTFVFLLAVLALSMVGVFTVMWFHVRYRSMIFVLLIPAAHLEARQLVRESDRGWNWWAVRRLPRAFFVVLASTGYEIWFHYWLYESQWWNFA